MKPWVYIALLVFIVVAGYKFGHYQNLLANSDKAKAELFKEVQDEPRTVTSPVKVVSDSVKPADGSVDGELRQNLKSWENARDALHPDTTEVTTTPLRIIEAEQELTQYFTLHPDADTLLLHSVRCELKGCELTGQFEGTGEDLQKLVEPLKQSYTSALNSMSTQDNITYFVLQVGASI